MVVSSRCEGPRPKMPDERARFAFLGQSSVRHRMTAEDELEQPSRSGRSSMLALRKTLSLTSVRPSCVSLDAWLACCILCLYIFCCIIFQLKSAVSYITFWHLASAVIMCKPVVVDVSDLRQWRILEYHRWRWYFWWTGVDTWYTTCCNC